MDLRALTYFTHVYEQGSISGAAKICYVAQPSLSAAIKNLEEELATSLFERHVRGIKPTESGKALYPLAKQLLGQATAIKSVFSQRQEKVPVKLGITKGLGVARMSSLLKEFTGSLVAMELTLVPPEESCDAKIVAEDEVQTGEAYTPMWREDYGIAMPHNHILSLKDDLVVDDLQGQPFIQRTPCIAWQPLTALLDNAGVTIDIRAKIQTIDYALGLVSAGVGLAYLPLYPETQSNSELVFKRLNKADIYRNIGLAYSNETDITRLLKRVVKRYQ